MVSAQMNGGAWAEVSSVIRGQAFWQKKQKEFLMESHQITRPGIESRRMGAGSCYFKEARRNARRQDRAQK